MMKYIISLLFSFTALPVFAHEEAAEKTAELGTTMGNMMSRTGGMHGYGMMGWGAPWMGGSWLGWLTMAACAIFWILVAVLLVALIRWVWKKGS